MTGVPELGSDSMGSSTSMSIEGSVGVDEDQFFLFLECGAGMMKN